MALAERPVRALRIQGPLGIWRFPLLNFALEFIGIVRVRGSPSSSPKTTYANIEEYSIWEDRSGVIRVRVHRKAKRG